ncbi:MAG: type II 3-dehydroquinate dehydratase [Armatimonadetes bacterium]|nr:type II 3-dehydroquinate dehydratase [Armatimonadota bacterium]
MAKVIVIHGPNLNMLGLREPEIYGINTLKEINERLLEEANRLGLDIETFQTNGEGEIIDLIQSARQSSDALILNPGAYSHYSLAIRDAVSAAGLPTIEVHLSNIYSRERFRRKSVIAGVCLGQITGFGIDSYILALHAVSRLLGQAPPR